MYSLTQRGAAEAFGTAALVLVGPGSVIATLTLAGKATPAVTEADLLGISFAFGFIITALVYAIGKVSGCHINPAVTFALAASRRFPWKELPVYWLAQVVGAIAGALAIWAAFGHQAVVLGLGQTAFGDSTSYLAAAFSELVGTGLLLFAIMGIVDSKSPNDLAGLVIGGAVVGIILIFGPVTGASLNPARALGPELVSTIGGGSGHEPMHGGFVGLGMLDAACPGEVFTSPVPGQMLAATKAVDGGASVVHIVKNYTGDVMNFKLAAEDAADEGIEVESVLIDDDVAVQDSLYTAGRRGVGATVLAEKVAGAAAERGDALAQVTGLVKRVNERSRSFGVALSSCIPPASGKAIFDLPEGQIELGIGIHGEPGRRRTTLGSASEVVDVMVEAVLSDLKLSRGAKVLVFLNGMGGTPLLELYLLYGEADRKLRAAGVEPVRNLVGSYITSLEMAGASLTVLELDDEMTGLWDAPVHTPALRWRA